MYKSHCNCYGIINEIHYPITLNYAVARELARSQYLIMY